jgi:hypothetical protein
MGQQMGRSIKELTGDEIVIIRVYIHEIDTASNRGITE